MTYLRIGEVARAVGVSVDTLRRWEVQGRVAFERRNNRRVLLASRLGELRALLGPPSRGTSARNHFDGIVVAVRKDRMMAELELACRDYRVVAIVSRESVDELGLVPGMRATAVIDAISVMVQAASV